MVINRLRAVLVAVTAAMIVLPELAMPVAAMPLAQPGAKALVDSNGLAANVEPVYYRRKFKGGGYRYHGGPRYWNGRKYGHNKYWKHNRYGWNNRWHGRHYGWHNGWNNGWCRYTITVGTMPGRGSLQAQPSAMPARITTTTITMTARIMAAATMRMSSGA
jgi:hypothetical protein